MKTGSESLSDYDEPGYFGYPEEEDEQDDRLMRVAVFLNMLPETEFSDALFENACYMANVDPDSFSEEEIEELMEML